MAQEIVQTIDVNLGNSAATVGELRQGFDATTAAIQKTEQTFEVLNNTSQQSVGYMKQWEAQAKKTTDALIQGMYGATEATKATSAATGELAESMNNVNQAGALSLDTLTKQRIAFQDVGRAVTEQGFSLRSLSSNFALLGPEITIAIAAFAFLGEKLYSFIDETEKATQAVKDLDAEFDQFQKRDEIVNKAIESETKLQKSRVEAARGTSDQIAKVEEEGLQKQIDNAKITYNDLLVQRDKLGKAIAGGDDSEVTKKKVDELNAQLTQEGNIIKGFTDRQEIARNNATTKKNKEDDDAAKREEAKRNKALADAQAFIDGTQKINDDAEEREEFNLTAKYQKDLKELQAAHLDSTKLTAAYQQGLLDIQNKYIEKSLDADDAAFDEALLHKQKRDEKAAIQDKIAADKELKALQDKLDAEQALRDKNDKDAQKALTAVTNISLRGDKNAFDQIANKQKLLDNIAKENAKRLADGTRTEQQAAAVTQEIGDAEIELQKQKRDAYADAANGVGQSLTTIGQALGEHTQAGKDFEIAGAVISAISSAVKSFDSLASIPYVGPALGAAAAAAALAAGYANVKKIEAVEIPGQGASSSVNTTPPVAYKAPAIPTATNNTNLSAQSLNHINQANTNPIRAFVVESDISHSQQTINNYRDASRVGGH